MMAVPNIAHIEHLFQELDFRMKSLNAVFCQEMKDTDDFLKTCWEMTVVQESEKKHQRYIS
jgi:orotidine-5'-phosphate decarboxylase